MQSRSRASILGKIACSVVGVLSFAAPAVLAEQSQPPAPYYSAQLASIASQATALRELKTVEDQPYARVEQRDGFYVIRVGAFDTPEAARVARDVFREKGHAAARVVKIAHPVPWLMADGSTVPTPGRPTTPHDTAPEEPAAAAAAPASPPPAEPPAAAPDKVAPGKAARPAAETPAPAKATAPAPAPVAAEPTPTPLAKAADESPLHLANAGGAANWNSTLVTFEQLGFLEGFSLEGSEGRRRLFFPLPPGVNVARAQLVFDIEWSPLLIAVSSIQFRVNDSIRTAIRRGEGSDTRRRIEIPLTAQDLQQNFVDVTVDYSLFLTEDVCLSRKLAGAYARFSLTSGLAVVSSDPMPRTVRAAWSLLPRDVKVASRLSELSPAEFQALFQLATELHREGFEIEYENLVDGKPTDAHIVLAPAERYLPAGADASERASNLRLVRSTLPPVKKGQPPEERAFILIDSTRPLASTGFVRKPWRNVPTAPALDVATATEWPQPRDADDVIRLKGLGFDDSERTFSFSADWHIALPFGPLGNGQRPSRALLEVYGPKVNALRGPTTLSAYFNDRLVYSAALKDTGEMQTLDFELPRIQLRARNNLKIVAQRDEVSDNCKLSQAPYPLSISTNSVIETKPLNETPTTFAELVPHQRSLELYVANNALAAAERVIPMLVGLGDHFWPDVPPPELRLYEPGAELKPAGPFFVVGDPKWDPQAFVRFDQGRVRIQSNATGQQLMLLDFSSKSSTTVLQMVQASGHGGAWLRSTAGYTEVPAKRALFEDENVAFLGARGVQTALHVGPARDYRVTYPESKSWFDATGQWRTVLFIVAWLLVVGLLLYLYLRTRRHGRN